MTVHDWSEVDRYLADTLLPPDPVLDATQAAADAAGLPAIDVSPLQGKLLYLLARLRGATRILELGTLAGYSAIWLARALPPGGRLITLELDPRYAEVARANLDRAGLSDVAEVRIGPALDSLAQLEGPFDLIFIDADKRGYPEYLEWSLRLARPGTLIIGDNTVRGGRVADPATSDPSVLGARRFHELIAADPRLTATAIQTVGIKGHDGFTLALVESL